MSHIAIDIGNTRIKTACFQQGQLIESAVFPHTHIGQLASWLRYHHAAQVIISSTAAETFKVDEAIPDDCKVHSLNLSTPLPIINGYESKTLGQDRIANAVAGASSNRSASLVIDAGTCVTYDWTIDGTYHGGGISPGLFMRSRAMHEFTGRLPLVYPGAHPELIGRSTFGSLESGAFWGMVFELDGIISAFKARFPEGSAIITGGDSLVLVRALENDIFADPLLTLRGLHMILEFNNA